MNLAQGQRQKQAEMEEFNDRRAKLHQAMAEEHMKINAGQTANLMAVPKRDTLLDLVQELRRNAGNNEIMAQTIKGKLFDTAQETSDPKVGADSIEGILYDALHLISDANKSLEQIIDRLGE